MTPYDRLMKITGALAQTAIDNGFDRKDIALRIDYDYWFCELMPSVVQSVSLHMVISRPEERMNQFEMNGILVVRDNRDPAKSLFGLEPGK